MAEIEASGSRCFVGSGSDCAGSRTGSGSIMRPCGRGKCLNSAIMRSTSSSSEPLSGIAEPAGSTDSGFAAFISTGASSDSNSRRIRSGSSFDVLSVAPSSASNSSMICVASKSNSSCGAAVLKPSFTTAENTRSDFFEVSATGAPGSKKGFSDIGSSSSAPNSLNILSRSKSKLTEFLSFEDELIN